MLSVFIDPASANLAAQRFTALKQRVIEGVMAGMQQGMDDLAEVASAAAPKRSGKLAAAIAASARVKKTAHAIVGSVSGDVGRKHVGIWIEEGTHVPAVVSKTVMRAMIGDAPIYFRRHAAFNVAARPFMNAALEDQRQAIFDAIRQHVVEATK